MMRIDTGLCFGILGASKIGSTRGASFSCCSTNVCGFQACYIVFVGDAHISTPVCRIQIRYPSRGVVIRIR